PHGAQMTENSPHLSRRQFVTSTGGGIGLAALSTLFAKDEARAAGAPALPGLPHFAPKARRVVILWQGGGPSHVDLFDDKPRIRAMATQDIPASIRGNTRLSTMSSGYQRWPCLPSIKPFRRYGQSGIALSEMLPNIGSIADDICVVRSMHTEAVN